MRDKLEPCPFCGGEAEMHIGAHNFDDCKIQCVSCNAEGPLFDDGDSPSAEAKAINRSSAVKHWNERVAP